MTRLILVRHGQSEANAKSIGAGQMNYPLTELGHRQAALTAEYLLKHEKIDAIYSSDLCRAYDTALPLADKLGLSIQTDTDLREINSGLFAGLPFAERNERFSEEVARLKADFSHMRYPGGEYIPEVYDRVVGCICRIAQGHDGQCVLFATHAGAVRMFEAFAEGFSREEAGNASSGENASIHIYEWNGTRASVLVHNFTDHLKDAESSAEESARV
ncbi:MAG: histidine phosphatase family protein [Clostridia bacterium]|nr:histidine phosphatase family protein [Clostridia bacterium]